MFIAFSSNSLGFEHGFILNVRSIYGQFTPISTETYPNPNFKGSYLKHRNTEMRISAKQL